MSVSSCQNFETDLKVYFGTKTYLKGKDYFLNKQILKLNKTESSKEIFIEALVVNSKKKLYLTRILLSNDQHEVRILDEECSCPLRYACKHVVAAFLEAFTPPPSEKKEKTFIHPLKYYSFPEKTSNWTTLFEKLKRTQESQLSQKPSEKIVFALQRTLNSHYIEQIKCGKSYILKSGRYAKPTKLPDDISNRNFDKEDLHLVSLLLAAEKLGGRYNHYSHVNGEFSTSSLRFFSDFQSLLNTERCFLSDNMHTPLHLGSPKKLFLSWEIQNEVGYQLKPFIDQQVPCFLLPLSNCWYIDPLSLSCGPLETDLSSAELTHLFAETQLLPLEEVEKFSQQQNTSQLALPKLPLLTPEIILSDPEPKLTLFGEFKNFREKKPLISLSFDYENIEVPIQHPKEEQHVLREGKYKRVQRNLEKEAKYLHDLLQFPIEETDLGFFSGKYTFDTKRSEKALKLLKSLEKNGWKIKVNESFPYEWLTEIETIHFNIEKSSNKNNWFDLELGVLVDGKQKSLDLMIKNLLEKQFSTVREIKSIDPNSFFTFTFPDGTKNKISGERLKRILLVLIELYDKKTHSIQCSEFGVRDLENWSQELEDISSWKKPTEFPEALQKITQMTSPPSSEPPPSLQASLRPYQQEGFNWLQQLRRCSFGGILADDMGLGKTVQTLAHLLSEKEAGRMNLPSLIVAPTSLVSNWQHEISKFTPLLSVLTLHGIERKNHFKEINKFDLVLTTYPLIVRDQEMLLNESFYYVILDEAQYIKNPLAKAFQALCQLQVQHRLCLSGTPIENNLTDLWSLFHFLNKGLLGSKKRFATCFRTPIEKDQCPQIQKRLSQRVAPFLLRRTKDKVAKELPLKNEIVKYISFEEKQRDFYEAVRVAMLEKIRGIVNEKGLAKSQIIILDALLKMRQICCDPRLIKMKAASSTKNSSAKLKYLLSFLETLLKEKRKVLLFSTFTSMLELIENELIEHKYSYVKLTGQTKKRKEVIETFQNGQADIFLISLKAGGTGLNLTTADTVIHYDPWWNPSAENQATDRAHRIGQDKPVFVYKLIMQQTIEEKILALQKKKQSLVENLFAAKEGGKNSLSMEEIEELFKPF